MKSNPTKLKNGMVAFIDGTISDTSKKWLDIEITNTFPIIALERALLMLPGKKSIEISEYDHLSIPSDLRIHLSGANEKKIFFDATQAWSVRDNVASEPLRLFTFVNTPIKFAPLLLGGRNRKWNQAALISPMPDKIFNPESTRMFIDFFIHKNFNEKTIINSPFANENMRLAYDRNGCILGPYSFEGLQRKYPTQPELLFTIRFGYAELESNDKAYLFVPFKIYSNIPTYKPLGAN